MRFCQYESLCTVEQAVKVCCGTTKESYFMHLFSTIMVSSVSSPPPLARPSELGRPWGGGGVYQPPLWQNLPSKGLRLLLPPRIFRPSYGPAQYVLLLF